MTRNAPAFRFRPFSHKQKKLLTWWMPQSPYHDYDMIVADGAIRSGKTIAMIDSFITWSLATFEHESFIIAGKSMGALKRNVLRPMFQMLQAKGIPYRYNRSEHYVEIGSNTYYCFGANNEASQDVLQGLTAAGAYGDEGALFPESFIDQMIGRCSVEGSKIWLNCNPAGPFHFIKVDYVDKATEKRILHLHFTLDDNLTLSEAVKARYKRMFTGVFFQRYILGLWVAAEGAIYDLFDAGKHTVVSTPKVRRYLVGIDYGTGNPTVYGLFGLNADPRAKPKVWLEREYVHDSRKAGRQKTDAEYSADLGTWLGGIEPDVIYLDPSAASFKVQLRKDGFRQLRDADNSVLDGIRTQATMLGNGEYVIATCCAQTVADYSAYVWDPKAQKRGEDKPLKQNDHTKDMERYVLHTHFGNRKQAGVWGR